MSTDTHREADTGPGGTATATLLLAPDSFKGTLPAPSVSAALARGVLRAGRHWRPVELPLADGGEGTLDALHRALGGRWFSATSRDPWGDPRQGRLLILDRPLLGLPTPVAAVEWSAAAGFVPDRSAAQAVAADSGGVGELMAAARREGCRSTLLALGGSATTDGAAGLLRTLGARLLDHDGRPLPPGAAPLRRIADVDLSALPSGPVVALTDVTSPLLGEAGTAARFAPQKGADDAACRELEGALSRWAEILDPARRYRDLPGAGAAGGAGFGLAAALGATLRPGAAAIAELCGLDEALASADRVWTGEGCIDGTSAAGKVVSEVLGRSPSPVDLVGGDLGPGVGDLRSPALHRIVTLADPPAHAPPVAWTGLGLPLTGDQARGEPEAALEALGARLIASTALPAST